jgi:hypothetical protein
MLDPNRPKDLQRIYEAVRACRRQLASARRKRRELIQDFVGSAYPQEWMVQTDMPVNMLAVMMDIYTMQLAGSNPRVILPTPRKELLPFAADLEAVVNQELEDMQFSKTLRRWVQEAMFCMGILKSGLVDGEYIEIIPGSPQPTQQYFLDLVDFDDFVFDLDAVYWDRVSFMGDRYKVNFDYLVQDDRYPAEARSQVKPREYGQPEDDEGSSEIFFNRGSEYGIERHLKRTAWVWDIALIEEGLIVTMADSAAAKVPLKVVEWDGPTRSPYHILSFSDVPSNILPLAPGQVVKSLNRAMNALFRKLIEQARRQKTLGMYRAGDQDDVEKIQQAEDGHLIGVSNPEVVKEINFGGANPQNMAFAMQIRDLFSMVAGNLDALGGLGPQSETYRQDAMIANTVSNKVAKMQVSVTDATVEVIRDLVARIWQDPLRTYETRRGVAGTDVEIAVALGPGDRQGSFEDFDIRIEPFSMQYRSPRERADEITALMTNLVFPVMPLLQQQGVYVDLQRLLETLAKYRSLPELNHIFQYQAPPMPGSAGEEPRQPDTGKRTYEHVSRPSGAGGANQQMKNLMSAGQSDQMSVTGAR